MSDIDPAAVMAAHAGSVEDDERYCDECCAHFSDGCEPYRLAEALAAMTTAHDIWRTNAKWAAEALVAEQAKVASQRKTIGWVASGWLRLLMEQQINDGTPVLEIVFAQDRELADRWRTTLADQPEQVQEKPFPGAGPFVPPAPPWETTTTERIWTDPSPTTGRFKRAKANGGLLEHNDPADQPAQPEPTCVLPYTHGPHTFGGGYRCSGFESRTDQPEQEQQP